MRIAFLADPLDRQYGGIHVYTRELLKAISVVDKRNEYFIFRSKAKGEFPGMKEVVVPFANFPGYRMWRLFFQLPKLIRKMEIDLVVEPAHFGPLNLPKKIKRITVIHDMTVFLFPKHHLFLSQFLQRLFLPGILKKTDHIVTNSENTSKDLIRFFPFAKDKTTAILLGKDDIFKPQKDALVLKTYNINQPFILYVGTLEPRKNVVTLIEAFNRFKTMTGMGHELVLVGKKGWKSEGIRHAIEHSPFKDSIIQVGYLKREDLPIFYSMAELFVYPSLYEGFGLPVLEAMACGTPVITSEISSLPEVGGMAAKYFEGNSPENLCQKLVEMAKDPTLREKHANLGLEQAAKFSWEMTALKMIEKFEQLQ